MYYVVTPSMQNAIDETIGGGRSRWNNAAHGIDPTPLRKRVSDITELLAREDADTDALIGGSGQAQSRGKAPVPGMRSTSDVGKHAAELAGMPARRSGRSHPAAHRPDAPPPVSCSSSLRPGFGTKSRS